MNQFTKIIVFSLFILFIGSTVFAGGWRTFGCDVFSISYPTGWKSVSSGHGTEVAIFMRQVSDPARQPFAENVNIVYEINTSGEEGSLQEAADKALAEIKNLVPNIEMVRRGYRDIGNYNGYEMVFKGEFMEMELKWKQVFFRQKHAWFVITYTGFGENFDNYESTADRMIASFRIK